MSGRALNKMGNGTKERVIIVDRYERHGDRQSRITAWQATIVSLYRSERSYESSRTFPRDEILRESFSGPRVVVTGKQRRFRHERSECSTRPQLPKIIYA